MTVLLIMGLMIITWAEDKVPEENKVNKGTVITGNNAFALDLYAQLRKQEGNLFFSPYSISTALAMTYVGARGETEKQMAYVLRFDPDQSKFHPAFAQVIHDLTVEKKKGYELNVANALWGQKGYKFLPEFLNLTNQSYGAGLRELDFATDSEAARQTINAWIEKQTNDKIKDLIQKNVLDKETRLVLTNAIYFKGNWDIKFDKEKTKDAPFTLINGEKINVPMMRHKEIQEFQYLKGDGFKALEISYVANELSMIIFLPDEINGLAELEKSMSLDNLTKWISRLHRCKVDVLLPKFNLTSEFSLKHVFCAMGMVNAFSDADFSGMIGKKELAISEIIHKTFVDINEEGTKAAAATAVIMTLEGSGAELFHVDHPFIFLIRDVRSGSILFMGRVMNPKV